jgi:branched-chain amino acid transport system permease protein
MISNLEGSKRYLPVLILIVIVILLQLFLVMIDQTFYYKELTRSAYYCIVVIGLCLLMGYAGQISLGHAGFFSIGGYTTAVLTTNNLIEYTDFPFVSFLNSTGFLMQREDLYGNTILAFTPWSAFIIAIIFTAIIAFLIGFPVIKLKGHYLAMATLGFGLIISTIINATPILGSHDPITSVPPFELAPFLEVNGRMPFRIQNYYIAWFFVILTLIIAVNIIHSRVGRALRSIHGNEEAANTLGVNTSRYKLYTFVLSAVFASIAGSLLTHYTGSIGPSEASVMKSVRYVAIVAVGGMSSLWGVVTISLILNFLSLRGTFGSYDNVFFGAILILIMLFAPKGILNIPGIKNKFIRLKERIIIYGRKKDTGNK